jgi:hypothetical protein
MRPEIAFDIIGIEWCFWGLRVLRAVLAEKQKINPENNRASEPVAHRPGVFHRVEERLEADYPPNLRSTANPQRGLDKINLALANARKVG